MSGLEVFGLWAVIFGGLVLACGLGFYMGHAYAELQAIDAEIKKIKEDRDSQLGA